MVHIMQLTARNVRSLIVQREFRGRASDNYPCQILKSWTVTAISRRITTGTFVKHSGMVKTGAETQTRRVVGPNRQGMFHAFPVRLRPVSLTISPEAANSDFLRWDVSKNT